MKLPSEFEARTLEWMGEETYRALKRLCRRSLLSVFVSIVRSGVGSCRRTGTLGICRDLFIATAHFYIRSVVSCWLLLCARSIFHVCGTGVTHLYYRTCSDARFVCCSRWKVYSCAFSSPVGSLLVANEVMRNRSQVLAENLIKWGNAVVVMNNDPADFTSLTEVF